MHAKSPPPPQQPEKYVDEKKSVSKRGLILRSMSLIRDGLILLCGLVRCNPSPHNYSASHDMRYTSSTKKAIHVQKNNEKRTPALQLVGRQSIMTNISPVEKQLKGSGGSSRESQAALLAPSSISRRRDRLSQIPNQPSPQYVRALLSCARRAVTVSTSTTTTLGNVIYQSYSCSIIRRRNHTSGQELRARPTTQNT